MNIALNPLFTVGHSNQSPESFISLLGQHGIDELVDIRSSPYNRNTYTAHFNKDTLAELLASHGIRYVFMGNELGGRPADRSCYDDEGRVVYERLAKTDDFFFGVQNSPARRRGMPPCLDVLREGAFGLSPYPAGSACFGY